MCQIYKYRRQVAKTFEYIGYFLDKCATLVSLLIYKFACRFMCLVAPDM
jgi:hypothetical protein